MFNLSPFLRKLVLGTLLLLISIPLFLLTFYFVSRATPTKANISVNTSQIVGLLLPNWKSLAQGGEEVGVRMLEPVVPQVRDLVPRYIRIDHIYDFYDVVKRDASGSLSFDWSKLDATVCDIYATGAKPFFVLGYMPKDISRDGTPIAPPTNWDDWQLTVQRTIEHYSGTDTVLCGGTVRGSQVADLYYEVWNEPDLESFGKWSIYGGDKDYKTLYWHASEGARQAQNTAPFSLGGPAITAPYRNWFQTFLRFANERQARVDFLSWHHYTTNPDDYSRDLTDIASWIPQAEYGRYASLPKVLSEWGYDSQPNPVADTNVGAAHTVASIRNLVEQKLQHAFSFEIKDGPSPSWGILTHGGDKKPRYKALEMLNHLEGRQLFVEGEGTFVRAVASISPRKTTLILVNYDKSEQNTELVPVTFTNLTPGTYTINTQYLNGESTSTQITVAASELTRSVLMSPNAVVLIEVMKL